MITVKDLHAGGLTLDPSKDKITVGGKEVTYTVAKGTNGSSRPKVNLDKPAAGGCDVVVNGTTSKQPPPSKITGGDLCFS